MIIVVSLDNSPLSAKRFRISWMEMNIQAVSSLSSHHEKHATERPFVLVSGCKPKLIHAHIKIHSIVSPACGRSNARIIFHRNIWGKWIAFCFSSTFYVSLNYQSAHIATERVSNANCACLSRLVFQFVFKLSISINQVSGGVKKIRRIF